MENLFGYPLIKRLLGDIHKGDFKGHLPPGSNSLRPPPPSQRSRTGVRGRQASLALLGLRAPNYGSAFPRAASSGSPGPRGNVTLPRRTAERQAAIMISKPFRALSPWQGWIRAGSGSPAAGAWKQ